MKLVKSTSALRSVYYVVGGALIEQRGLYHRAFVVIFTHTDCSDERGPKSMRRSASKDDPTKRAPPLWYADDKDEAESQMSVDGSRQPLYVGGGGGKASFALSESNGTISPPPHQSRAPGHASSHVVSVPRDSTMSITLAQFVQSYSDLLPAEIIVVEGANSPPVALSDKDILKVDRIKEHSMVLARANKNQQYLIPFNAAIEFCVLYDPESNTSKALKGYSFEKVSDLISAEVKPKLVCARSSWEDRRTGTVVVTNREVFAVGKKVISARRSGKQEKSIKMYSITKHVTKELPEDCTVHFSTKPSLLPLYLAEIMEYVKSPFPCKAVLHDEGLVVPPHFSSLVTDQSGLILNLVSVNKGLVMEATYSREGMESPVVMEIPVELPLVKVKVLQCSRERRSADYNRTKNTSDCPEGTENVRNLQYHDQEEEDEMEDEENREEDEEGEEGSTEEKSGEYQECFKAIRGADATDIEVLRSCGGQHSIDPKIETAPMSQRQFVEQYGHCLPAHVKIVESASESHVDEIYKVHFVTEAGGISMIDDKGFLVLVSTDSTTQFGVVYNPHKDLDGAVKGYSFENVDEVVRETLLPRVLCASETYKTSSPASSVEAGEVLIVQKVEIGLQSKTSALTVYSIKDRTTKNLQSDCKGYFSTDPSRIQLHVSAILEHVPSVLPTVAMMYLAGQVCGAIISEPTKVTLLQHHAKPCLVATTAPSSRRDWNRHQLVEIPLDTSVRMMVMQEANFHDATSTAKSNADTVMPEMRHALLNFAKGDVIHLPYGSVIDERNAAAYRPTTAIIASRGDRSTREAQRSKPRSKGCRNPSSRPQEGIVLLDRSVEAAVPHASHMLERYEMLSRSVVDLTERLTALAERVTCAEGKLNERVSGACKCNEGTKTAGRLFVESLTTKEVLRLLDAAGLGAYSESFDREKIDGQLLCMLNDTLLQQDLNVSSSLHRLKLLGIISGTVDVRSWIAVARPARNTTV